MRVMKCWIPQGGLGSHFEIWSEEGWQKEQEAAFALGDELPSDLEDLAL